MEFKSRVIKYGDNINTDVIIPARYLNTSSKEDLARHCMEDLDAGYQEKLKTCKIIAAGKNFGCGSSREHAPMAILASGISFVVAESFARIFYRNAFNIGLPILECSRAGEIQDGDNLAIDVTAGRIKNLTQNTEYDIAPLPEFMQEMVKNVGLIGYIKKQIEQNKAK